MNFKQSHFAPAFALAVLPHFGACAPGPAEGVIWKRVLEETAAGSTFRRTFSSSDSDQVELAGWSGEHPALWRVDIDGNVTASGEFPYLRSTVNVISLANGSRVAAYAEEVGQLLPGDTWVFSLDTQAEFLEQWHIPQAAFASNGAVPIHVSRFASGWAMCQQNLGKPELWVWPGTGSPFEVGALLDSWSASSTRCVSLLDGGSDGLEVVSRNLGQVELSKFNLAGELTSTRSLPLEGRFVSALAQEDGTVFLVGSVEDAGVQGRRGIAAGVVGESLAWSTMVDDPLNASDLSGVASLNGKVYAVGLGWDRSVMRERVLVVELDPETGAATTSFVEESNAKASERAYDVAALDGQLIIAGEHAEDSGEWKPMVTAFQP